MPICTKSGLEKSSQPIEDFNDSEEVFYCETTKEIFRNYDDYFRRIMLINSTVWTCEYSGRSDLTYEEALKSEKEAKRSANYFSVALRGPVLLAAKRAQQSTHSTLSNLLYQFFKDRYFPGEAVMATVKKNKLCQCMVVEIIAPKQNTVDAVCPAANIKYKIKTVDSNSPATMVVSSDEIRRYRKKFLTRETLLYFLKESTEMSSSGYLVPKDDAYKKYVTELNVSFESLFIGKLPDWKPIKSRKSVSHETDQGIPNENISNEKEKGKGKGKEKKQETLSKYLVKKNGELLQKEKEKQLEVERILKERLEKLQKEKEERQAEIERKRIERQEKIEEKWLKISKKCDDLEREDQKPLPPFTPVRTIVPVKYFGDLIHIKEFIQSHAQIIAANPFKNRITLYEMCRAFTEREVAGPLSDIVQLLLNTIFSLQREEDEDCKAKYDIPRREHREEMLNAGLTHRIVQKHYSCRINELPVDAFSVSEVLRLHLLSSGASPDEKTEKWRFSYRNGYDGSEDPGLDFIRRHSHIIRALQLYAIYQLPFSYIIKILNCLIHQILTYSGALNLIEDRTEAFNETQKKLRAIQVAENKRIATVTNEKKQLAGELSIQSAELTVKDEKRKLEYEINKKVEKVIVHDEHQREKFTTELTDLEMSLFDHIVHLGSDRAYRNYYIFESLPGIFVEHLPESNDICLENPPKNDYRIAHCPHNKKEMKLLLLKMIAQEDKVKEKEKEKRKKTVMHNGEANKENQAFISNGELTKSNGSPVVLPVNGEIKYDNPQLPTAYDLYMCTGDPKHCIVHDDRNPDRIRWSFIHSEEGLDDLLDSLNPHGIRESVLREHILRFKSLISEHIKNCPTVFPCLSVSEDNTEEFKKKVFSETQRRYRDGNFGSNTCNTTEVMHCLLVDEILDFEANITAGCLGKLKITNLEQWRSDIRNNSYNTQCTKLIYGLHDQTYKDPGNGLADTEDIESEDRADDEISLNTSPELLKSVKDLASALLQIEQAIDQRFLKSPFGITVDRNATKDDERYEAGRKRLKLWEMSLMGSMNYSQVYLHKYVLSNAVKWYRSSLKARCIICNRKGDAQNLLLCDDCNAGSHMYCLEPKLTSIPLEDWFCRNCKAKRDEAEKSKEEKKRSPKKKVFKIDEDEECEDENENELTEKIEDKEDVEMDEANDQSCFTCFEEGGEISCNKCNYWFHLECVEMRRPPRGKWECLGCKMKDRKRKAVDSDKDSIDSDEILTRRSKRQRLVLSDAESEASESKRPKRTATAKQTSSRRFGRTTAEDLPLNSAVLYELLNDIMKHEDAWPFIRPVSQHELPDYYHVIQKPMDFARVKSNLNMARYKTNEELLKDIELIFSNCDVYNQQGNDIYNAGSSLEKYVVERCRQLNLPFTPSDMLTEVNND